MRLVHLRLCAAVLVGLATLGACGRAGTSEADAARSAAESFSTAVTQDPARACSLLAPKTLEALESEGGCSAVLAEQDLPDAGKVRRIEVFGTDAIADLGEDTLFLALFPGAGWRVTAAGCQETDRGRPYDCAVEGH